MPNESAMARKRGDWVARISEPDALDQLATYDDPMTEADLAEFLDLKPRTLREWRAAGKGPEFVRYANRSVRYPREKVAAWVASQCQGV